MILEFSGEIWYWKGPAPFYFITVPKNESEQIYLVSKEVTYGWGMIPVSAKIGDTEWETALFAKDGGYVLPVKAAVRSAEGLHEGDEAFVELRGVM